MNKNIDTSKQTETAKLSNLIILKTNFEMVIDFHKQFGLAYTTVPQMRVFIENIKLLIFRLALIDEEVGELKDAIDQKDFVEIMDALGDILYVTYGFGASIGINMDTIFSNITVHGSATNFLKTVSIIKKIQIDDIDVDSLHNPLTNVFDTNPQMLKAMMVLINARVCEMKNTIETANFEELTRALGFLLYEVYSFGVNLGINLDTVYDLVHKSNMSKLCVSEDEAIQTVEWYTEQYLSGALPYDTPAYRISENGEYYVVYNKSTSKILKSINYNMVNLVPLLK
jgi:predicted HAD superfamily Cof-like phosphohydrolase